LALTVSKNIKDRLCKNDVIEILMTKTKVDMAEGWAKVKIQDEMHRRPKYEPWTVEQWEAHDKLWRKVNEIEIIENLRFAIIPATPIDRTEYEIPDLIQLMLPVPDADQHAV
jgi:hypothetical protein